MLRNLARVTTATTGTGTITLGAAVNGFLTFAHAGVADGEAVTYCIADGANSEIGRGTYTSSGTTLSRDTVLRSTGSGNTGKITLSGTAQVFITPAAEDLLPLGAVLTPGGRCSLSNGIPYQVADVVGGTSIFYLPAVNNYLPPVLGGLVIPDAGLTLALDSNSGHTGYHQSGKNFDLFLVNDAGTLRFGSGPAWTNDTTRSAAITTKPGYWLNTSTMTIRYGASSGNTLSAAASTVLLVGCARMSADGQCTVQFNPAAAAGGNNTVVGLFNVYNRKPRSFSSRDTSSWTYGTNTWRPADNSASNRISWIDGLGVLAARAITKTAFEYISGTIAVGNAGANLNSISATPALMSFCALNATATDYDGVVIDHFEPVLGFNFAQAMELVLTGSIQFYGLLAGGSRQVQGLQIDMEH